MLEGCAVAVVLSSNTKFGILMLALFPLFPNSEEGKVGRGDGDRGSGFSIPLVPIL